MPATILIVDDEEGIRISLRGILEDEGHEVAEADSAENALCYLQSNTIDLIFLDVWLPQMDGLTLLESLHTQFPEIPVLMISGHGNIETAVNAIKKGAHDFIEKPLSLDKVVLAAERALEFTALKRENSQLKENIASTKANGPMGSSPIMTSLREQIARVAPLDTWVLISGENGTGKELVARAVHSMSRRHDKPMVALNCAAIPEELIESELFGHEKGAFTGADSAKTGKFEMANNGTLFLDEIGDMSLKTQAKILRILQEKTFERVGGNRIFHVDVRVIAATNKDLENAIQKGEFREDLYYRLRVFPVQVPPLRERDKDILLLAEYLSVTLAQDLGLAPVSFTDEAKDTLLRYPWPGNVRELRNFIERMIILHPGKKVCLEDLPIEYRPRPAATLDREKDGLLEEGRLEGPQQYTQGFLFEAGQPDTREEIWPAEAKYTLATEREKTDFKTARSAFEAQFLATKLQEFGGNVSRLAEAIGLERSYLHRKLKLYNIQGNSN